MIGQYWKLIGYLLSRVSRQRPYLLSKSETNGKDGTASQQKPGDPGETEGLTNSHHKLEH